MVVVREGVRWLARRGGQASIGLRLMKVWGVRRVRRSGLAGEMPLVPVRWARVLRMRYRQSYALVVVWELGCPTHVVGRFAQAVVVLGLVQVLHNGWQLVWL